MGEYFRWVNFDRKEYILPRNFEEALRSYQTMYKGSRLLAALQELVSHEWEKSHIAFIGDEWNIPENVPSAAFDAISKQMEQDGYNNIYDYIIETFVNVSGKFKSTEESVTEDIESYLATIKYEPDYPNDYGIDINDPYQGLFLRSGTWFEYTINETLKIGYSMSEIKVFMDDEMYENWVPLPYLMGYGRSLKLGPWFGDIVSFRNHLDDDIRLIDRIYLYFDNDSAPRIVFDE